MKQIAPMLILCLLPLNALADEIPKTNPPLIEGLDELAEGMRKLFDSFSDDVEPMLEGLAEQLKGLDAYHAPEILPNGDIIIRRKQAEEPKKQPETREEGPIDI